MIKLDGEIKGLKSRNEPLIKESYKNLETFETEKQKEIKEWRTGCQLD